MEQKEREIKELNGKEMEQAAGGTFDDDKYKQSEYEAAGMTYVYHTIARNEFWWKGTDIGHGNANAVVLYYQDHGKQPATLEEARQYWEKKHNHSCDLVHVAGLQEN